jgi:hypothetical protein
MGRGNEDVGQARRLSYGRARDVFAPLAFRSPQFFLPSLSFPNSILDTVFTNDYLLSGYPFKPSHIRTKDIGDNYTSVLLLKIF